jgi:hypothetical protein
VLAKTASKESVNCPARGPGTGSPRRGHQVHQEVADLLGGPRPVRVRGDPEDVYVAAADFDDEETARPHQGIAQRIPDDERDASRATVTDVDRQQIRRKPVLGGLINEYTQAV